MDGPPPRHRPDGDTIGPDHAERGHAAGPTTSGESLGPRSDLVEGPDLVLRTDERFTVSEVTAGPRSALIGRQLPDLFAAVGEPLVAVAERGVQRETVQRCRVVARGWSTDRYLLRLTPLATPAGSALAVSGIIDDQEPNTLGPPSLLQAQPGDPLWALIEHFQLGVFIKDRDYRFTFGNRTMLDALRLGSLDELRGRTDDELHCGQLLEGLIYSQTMAL